MFNEPQLFIVFRVALEIEMVYGLQNDDDAIEDQPPQNTIQGDQIIPLDGEIPLSPDVVLNYNMYEEG